MGPETTDKPLDPGEADALDHVGRPVKHDDAGVFENPRNRVGLAGLEIVIAQDAEHGDALQGQLERIHQQTGFLGKAVISQIATQQQNVGGLGRLCKHTRQLFSAGFGAVDVPHGRDPHAILIH